MAQTTSLILCRRVTLIRHGLVSARRPVVTILFHGQERNVSVAGPVVWNSLPAAVREAESLYLFKRKLKTHLFTL